jgi:hypothetical protein
MADGGGRQLAPFRFNTRQRRKSVQTMAMPTGGGQGTPVLLNKIGYLAKLFLLFEFDISNSSTVTAADLAPFSIVKRITVQLNNSSQVLFDTSGYGAFLINTIKRQNGRIDQSSNTTVYQFPTASGNNQKLRFGFEIPINLSDGVNFEAGLINLQAPEVQCQVNVNFEGTAANVGSNLTINSGNCYIYSEYYEVPDPTQVLQPEVLLHKWSEDQQPISQTGDNIYTVPNGGKLMRLITIVRCNGARSAAIDSQSLRVNTTDYVYQEDNRLKLWLARYRYGYDLPTGCYVQDFANSYDHPEETDMRDFLDTERITTLENITTITSGTTLGTGTNFLNTLRETIQAVG